VIFKKESPSRSFKKKTTKVEKNENEKKPTKTST